MKEVCFIDIRGCDDNTLVEMQLDEDEIKLLEELAKKSHEVSTYVCMPRIEVIKGERAKEMEESIFDSLVNDY